LNGDQQYGLLLCAALYYPIFDTIKTSTPYQKDITLLNWFCYEHGYPTTVEDIDPDMVRESLFTKGLGEIRRDRSV
jgi:hypothetical protein